MLTTVTRSRPSGVLTEFDGAIHSQQDVVALDVPVDHLVGVQELQGLKTLHTQQKNILNKL